ncbi:TetR/AcrR family transcriptional regulator [Actinomadura macrotermitis]|uniref:HTH tetR-type domain-containing protein n=1 Tax=Actinomadura macrotermitis TaxID=2585200 RepID=A0A7K0C0I1_9ACTN|nr:TetR/AcrR family transcriptional regulator [Actinomadura macrotermitis]MQY06975.1 hypothetical protein [Actinomadura macrotermitis]
MARLTRSETQARNREELLNAAERLFLREGYQSASISKIADEAGLSTGAVYSNFTGKPEIALLVVRRIQERNIARLSPLLAEFPAGRSLRALRAWAEETLASGLPRLELEFALDAKSDTGLLTAETGRHRSAIDWLTAAIEKHLPALPPGLTHRLCAEAVLNFVFGLAVRRVIDPTVTAKPFSDFLETMLLPAE